MDVVLRTIFAFGFLLLITRVVGKRELGDLQAFDLILLVVLGDLVQQGVTQADNSLTGVVIVFTTLAVLISATSYANFRFAAVRSVLDGNPVVLVEDGAPVMRNLTRERITVGELAAEARLQQISTLDDVRFAVLETNGRISFIPRSAS
jgi:uncharacterized membrane protein YcaP (DUF421 family)